MPLASWYTGQWYGPAVAASVVSDTSSFITSNIKANARSNSSITATASITLAKPTRLVNRPATLSGSSSVPTALPKARVRLSSRIRVNELTQDDVTGAVLEAQVLPGLTLKQALIDARNQATLAAALSA